VGVKMYYNVYLPSKKITPLLSNTINGHLFFEGVAVTKLFYVVFKNCVKRLERTGGCIFFGRSDIFPASEYVKAWYSFCCAAVFYAQRFAHDPPSECLHTPMMSSKVSIMHETLFSGFDAVSVCAYQFPRTHSPLGVICTLLNVN